MVPHFILAITLLASPEIIDRILAVVGNSIITQSDLVAAERLGLEKAPRGAEDPTAASLERLIERRLMLIEVDRYAPPEPPPANVDLRLEQVRLSFPSLAAFEAVLKETGLDEIQLRRRLRDDLRIDAYLQQRFGTVVQPTEEQILEYYQAHPAEFTTNGVLRSFNEVHEDVRQALATERRSRAIRDWLGNLRRRANVNVLYAPK
ncbi:MAG TPA: hypothetical protein VF147_10705 [Vicinamibacterales bacterium]